MTQRTWPRFRIMFLSPFLSAVLVFSPWSGVQAQSNAPRPEALVVYPEGAVDVRHLPPPAEARMGGNIPRHFPDLQLLIQHKEGLKTKGPEAPPAPAPSPLSVLPGGTSPSVTTSTIGLRQSESGGFYPPDTQVAAGPGHIVEAVNLEGRIWDKSNLAQPVLTFNLCTFFLLPNCNFASDPKVRFDPVSGRWFIAIITYKSPTGTWKLAVSQSGDPTGIFFVYTIRSARGTFPDFPAVGMSQDKIVLTGNAFSTSGFFLGTEFVVLNKSQLLAGTTVNGQFYPPPQGLFTIQPAFSLPDSTGTVISTVYMAAVDFNSATSVRIWQVTGIPGVGSGATVTVAGDLTIPTLSSPPNAQQLGTIALIQTNDNALLDAVYRNGSLWVSANSACTPPGDSAVRACLRLMQILTSGGLSLNQASDFGTVGNYYYYPAIQIDSKDTLVTVFSGSSASTYASVYASGQLAGATNTLGVPVLFKAGETSYTPNRWGDYSGAGIDPVDQTKVWVAGEYALNNGSGSSEWGTAIAEVGF